RAGPRDSGAARPRCGRAGRDSGTRGRAPAAGGPAGRAARASSGRFLDGSDDLDRLEAVVARLDRLDEVARDVQRLVDLGLDLLRDVLVLVQELLGVVAPLTEALLAVGEERAGLGHDVVL